MNADNFYRVKHVGISPNNEFEIVPNEPSILPQIVNDWAEQSRYSREDLDELYKDCNLFFKRENQDRHFVDIIQRALKYDTSLYASLYMEQSLESLKNDTKNV